MSMTKRLRDLLARPGAIPSLGAHDVFTARLMEQAGLEMIFLGGFGAAASTLGLPDVGLLTGTEMAEIVRRTTARVNIPVIADGDTGHGDLHNVARTVRDFEAAGAAGILLEDQVSPKRCGHFEGKQIIPTEDMVMKFKAALDARRDPNFVILARTDARAIEGIDGAIARACRYAEVGADMCFIEAPTTLDELRRIPAAVPKPLLVNMLTGGATPIVEFQDLEAMGYKIVVCPIETLMVTGFAVRSLIQQFLTKGRVDGMTAEMLTFGELKECLGLREIMGLRDRLP